MNLVLRIEFCSHESSWKFYPQVQVLPCQRVTQVSKENCLGIFVSGDFYRWLRPRLQHILVMMRQGICPEYRNE